MQALFTGPRCVCPHFTGMDVQVCCVVEASSLYAVCHMCPVCKTLANDGVPGLCTEHEFVHADLEMFLCNTCGAIMFLDLPRKPSLDDLERYRVSLEEADPALVRFLGNPAACAGNWYSVPTKHILCCRRANIDGPPCWAGIDEQKNTVADSSEPSPILWCRSHSLTHPSEPYPIVYEQEESKIVGAHGSAVDERFVMDVHAWPIIVPNALHEVEVHVFLDQGPCPSFCRFVCQVIRGLTPFWIQACARTLMQASFPAPVDDEQSS